MYKHILLSLSIFFTGTSFAQDNCQIIIPQAEYISVTPTTVLDSITGVYNDYYDICQNEIITISASGQYPENNTTYNQSDETSTFTWTVNGDNPTNGATFSQEFTEGGGYILNLSIEDSQGCTNDVILKFFIRVSTTPEMTLTAEPTEVCPGQESVVNANIVFDPTTWNAEFNNTFSEELFIPDGPNCPPGFYQTGITFDNFYPSQTLTSVTDLTQICVNMEHTFMGDLTINLLAPDGSTVILLEDQNDTGVGNGLGGTDLGIPNNTDSFDASCDSLSNPPGTGYIYCWSPSSTNNNWHDLDAAGTLGNPVNESDPINQTNIYPAYNNSFNNLLNTPLNGEWNIEIIDTWGSDNGWIFEWWIDFNPDIIPPEWGFTPEITESGWAPAASTIDINDNLMTIQPNSEGTYTYYYTLVDNFGCDYSAATEIDATSSLQTNEVVTNDYCLGAVGAIDLNLNGGNPPYNISWNTDDTSEQLENLEAGTYYFNVEDGLGCSTEGSIVVQDIILELGFDVSTEYDHCDQGVGSIELSVLNGNGPYTYLWEDGVSELSFADNLYEGEYTVDIIDSDGCLGQETVEVTNIPGPTALFTLSSDTVVYLDGFVNFYDLSYSDDLTYINEYSWNFDDGGFSDQQNSSHDFNSIGEYNVQLTVTDGGNCQDTYTTTVYAIEDYFIWAPSVFTPNGDNRNDYYKPVLKNVIASTYELFIYDRWGKQVYFSDNYNDLGWDGIRQDNGLPADINSYTFVLRFDTYRNELQEEIGSFIILK
jgi:gliding motility-associated-like protein